MELLRIQIPQKRLLDPALVILLAIWVFVQFYFFVKLGIRTGADSWRYLSDSDKISHLDFASVAHAWYVGYSIFITLVFYLGGTQVTVVILQTITNAIAGVMLFKLSNHYLRNRVLSYATLLLFIVWWRIQEWNLILYTDSLFISCCIISYYGMVFSTRRHQYLLTVILIVFTFFLRPHGFSFLAGVLMYYSIQKYRSMSNQHRRRVVPMLSVITLIFSFFLLDSMLSHYDIVSIYQRGELVVPGLNTNVPNDLVVPDTDLNQLVRISLFVWYNPDYFFKITFLKLFLFVSNYRPYFAWTTNVLSLSFLLPIYFFAIFSLFRGSNFTSLKAFVVTFFVVQACSTVLTGVSWEGRYLSPLVPFLLLLASVGVSHVVKSRRKKSY